ncbi:MAG TPA: CPBP family intramembrane metalloprotease [Candidatus Korarchaeota archaeon]|nr:CPBP family intramembrane metalloprotease [Candidatus Korarchaeota archaeon]
MRPALALVASVGVVLVAYSLAFPLVELAKSVSPGFASRVESDFLYSSAIVSPVIAAVSLVAMWAAGLLRSLKAPSARDLAISALVGLIGAAIVEIAMALLPGEWPSSVSTPRADLEYLLAFLSLAVGLASLAEEFLFRGVVQGLMDASSSWRAYVGPVQVSLGMVAGALLFGLLHFAGFARVGSPWAAAAAGISSTILGLLAGEAYLTTGSLWCAVEVHALFNVVGLAVGLALGGA